LARSPGTLPSLGHAYIFEQLESSGGKIRSEFGRVESKGPRLGVRSESTDQLRRPQESFRVVENSALDISEYEHIPFASFPNLTQHTRRQRSLRPFQYCLFAKRGLRLVQLKAVSVRRGGQAQRPHIESGSKQNQLCCGLKSARGFVIDPFCAGGPRRPCAWSCSVE
jgi:hypothetical protein